MTQKVRNVEDYFYQKVISNLEASDHRREVFRTFSEI